MKKILKAAADRVQFRLIIGFIVTLISSVAAAQGTGAVLESRGFTPGQQSSRAPSSNSNNDALSLLLEQNRQLQAEVSALRGLVEEQGFEIRKLQRDSLSRYTNTDERLSALESGATSSVGVSNTTPPVNNSSAISSDTGIPNQPFRSNSIGTASSNFPTSGNTSIVSPNTTNPANTSPRDTSISALNNSSVAGGSLSNSIGSPGISTDRPVNGRGTLQPAVLSEQQLYQMAYDSVINSNFERSIAEFDQYLSIYPSGRFITNAYYWKGQAYLYLDRFEEARDSYEIILNQYTDSPKLPDAMYGLGLAYQGMGNISQARSLLTDIKRRFPNTGVANLADTRLLSLD